MSMFRTKKQLPFNMHDDLMKEQFYTVYHELKKSGKQLFTVSSTKDRGVVASLIVNMGLVFAEMKKKVLLIDVNFSDPKLHVLLQSNHMITVNDIISSSPAIMNLFLVICLNTYIVFLQKKQYTQGHP
ncbi:capsular polysaccharide biosynthesis protein tyrosine kinase [Bacillus cereus]|nr:capsular polysaccharide biosynthesis protein tyrosine kinase [Bacillus cereus]